MPSGSLKFQAKNLIQNINFHNKLNSKGIWPSQKSSHFSPHQNVVKICFFGIESQEFVYFLCPQIFPLITEFFTSKHNLQAQIENWSLKKYQKSLNCRKNSFIFIEIQAQFHKIIHFLFIFKSSSFEIRSTFLRQLFIFTENRNFFLFLENEFYTFFDDLFPCVCSNSMWNEIHSGIKPQS